MTKVHYAATTMAIAGAGAVIAIFAQNWPAIFWSLGVVISQGQILVHLNRLHELGDSE